MRRIGATAACGVILLGLLAAGIFGGGQRSAVDWRRLRAVCLASDDWGLAGFLPDSAAIAHLDRQALAPGRVIEIYWHSTLEDSAMTAALGQVLAAHRGRDGLPAVLQPNYIMASLAYRPATADSPAVWTELEFPEAPPGYERPGLWPTVRRLQAEGLWHPELHGRWHYDPESRRRQTAASPAVQAAAARQIMPFPGAEAAWELGSWRDFEMVTAELDRNLQQFESLFGYPPRSVIAPDYQWRDEHERLWCARGLRIIQGQRQQRQADWTGPLGRARKLFHRMWTRWSRPDRVYLDRNCLFEPVQRPAGEDAVKAASGEVTNAWRLGQPAILQTHRINFVHLEAALRARGLAALDELLAELAARSPLFLVDAEVADLGRRGTSWLVRGDRLILRNETRSQRLVVVPPQALRAVARQNRIEFPEELSIIKLLAPGELQILDASVLMGD